MEDRFEEVSALFTKCFEHYYATQCQCAFPRYHQIISIDCVDTGDSFSCYETEMLIEMSKPYFDIQKGPKGHEGAHQVWTCRKCGSTYSYDWEDFSIHVSRVTMKATETKVAPIGKPAVKPIPLFLGLSGHSFPPQTEMVPVSYEDFEVYMLEL
ncbi:MAG: hypothetical protein IPP25_10525 [Saprospiraceae bacterium]|nr:hypothetical protein [Candidatus Opimibacter skivensis]